MNEGIDKTNIIAKIETEREGLNSFLEEPFSNREKLIKLSNYFDLIISSGNGNIINAFLPEFIPQYINLLDQYDPYYIAPAHTDKIISIASKIITLNNEYFGLPLISDNIIRIEEQFKSLINILNGGICPRRDKLTFPVLESDSHFVSQYSFGFLESLSVQIRKNKSVTKFLLIPSESQLEEKIAKQLSDAWENALKYLRNNKIKTLNQQYEVLIAFNRKEGTIVGNSLGVVLTIAFIEELLKFHNSKMIVDAKENISLTGGVETNGKIISTSREIIRIKTDVVFYSSTKIFCIPKENELAAEERLAELKNEYPNRKLEIVALSSFNDLLNRRNIIEIRRQKLLVRTGKFIKKNWVSAVVIVLLSILFGYLFVMDFDDNPAMFEQKSNLLNIQNKNGKVLWSTRLNFTPAISEVDRSKFSKKLVDINNDGVNEVLIAEEEIAPESYNFGRVACFDKDKRLVWEYFFRDTVLTFRRWTNTYSISILDTITISNQKILFLMARNIPNFANAVFAVDVLTGKRMKSTGTLWNAGAINNCIVGDFNEDGMTELIIAGSHNGYERALLFSVNIDKMNGQTPAPNRYIFNDIPAAKINKFILLPHTDYGKHFWRSNSVPSQHLVFVQHSKEFELATLEGSDKPILFYYRFDKNLNFLWVDCADNAQQLRDSLVANGILNPPFTNTNEYFEILRKEIKCWYGEKFIEIEKR